MSEKSLWSLTRTGIKGEVPSHELHLERIENAAGAGTPDVNYCIRGTAGWVELKYIDEWPKREDTLVAVDHFTKEQRIFLHNYSMAGGRCFVWIQVDGEYFLFDGLRASMYLGHRSKSNDNGWRRSDFYTEAICVFVKGNIRWYDVVHFLEGEQHVG